MDDLEPLIPHNVTRRDNLSMFSCGTIALAPWASPECVVSVIERARYDGATAMLVYQPGSSNRLPPKGRPVWNLSDSQYLNHASLPVYAISGSGGQKLMGGLAQYSGNISDAPGGDELRKTHGEDTYLKLFGTIRIAKGEGPMSSLWVFLLAVLAILVGIILGSSLIMRLAKRRRRHSLQRRLAAGEVDIEMLGIKQLNVPQHLLDKMPLYTYSTDVHSMVSVSPNTGETNPNDKPSEKSAQNKKTTIPHAVSNFFDKLKGGPVVVSQSAATLPPKSLEAKPNEPCGHLTFSQITCPICLDDYVVDVSSVRELPCRHIFHPDCVDNFLLQNSSLCPVCKESVLPPGYFIGEVTDVMVRQERMARMVQRRRRGDRSWLASLLPMPRHPPLSYHPQRRNPESHPERRTSVIGRVGRSISSASYHSNSHATSPAHRQSLPPVTETLDPVERQEEMRRRAVALLGPREMIEDQERERDSARPICKFYLQV